MHGPSVVLLHSPLVTAATWGDFPAALHDAGLTGATALVEVSADDEPPYAARYVAHAAQQLAGMDLQSPLVLIGHSGAGALLPQVGASQRSAGRSIGGYVFIDAVLPRPGATRLDLLEAEDRTMAAEFRADLEAGAQFPSWSDDDLVEALPDPRDRATVLAGMQPRGLDFFTEPIPHPEDWPDAPCGYLRTSDAYRHWSRVAELRGWATEVHRPDAPVGHFAALRDPGGLAESVIALLDRM